MSLSQCALLLITVLLMSCMKETHRTGNVNSDFIFSETDTAGVIYRLDDKEIRKSDIGWHRLAAYQSLLKQRDLILVEKLILELRLKSPQEESPVLYVYVNDPGLRMTPSIQAIVENMSLKVEYLGTELSQPDLLAQVDGQPYYISELMKSDVRLFSHLQKIFSFQMKLIKKHFTQTMIRKVATTKGLPATNLQLDLLRDFEIPEREYDEAIASMDAQAEPEEIQARIKMAHYEKKADEFLFNWAKAEYGKPVEVLLESPKMELRMNQEWVTYVGPREAPVTVMAFSNFHCSTCRALNGLITELRQEFANQIRIGYYHFFFEGNRAPRESAELAMCLRDKDDKQFWGLVESSSQWGKEMREPQLYKVAEELGADINEIKDCFISRTYGDVVQYNIDYANYIGIKHFPTLIINGIIHTGAINHQDVRQTIKAELRKAENTEKHMSAWQFLKQMFVRWFQNLF